MGYQSYCIEDRIGITKIKLLTLKSNYLTFKKSYDENLIFFLKKKKETEKDTKCFCRFKVVQNLGTCLVKLIRLNDVTFRPGFRFWLLHIIIIMETRFTFSLDDKTNKFLFVYELSFSFVHIAYLILLSLVIYYRNVSNMF